LHRIGRNNVLPINYQYEFSSWIYKILHYGDPIFSTWLHQNGYLVDGKQFRLFTFSQLFFPNYGYAIKQDRLIVKSRECYLEVALLVEEAAQHFVMGIFKNQKFGIGDRQSVVDFSVASVERLPEPSWEETMTFRCISPLCVAIKTEYEGKESTKYLSPEAEDYGVLLQKNLMNKWLAFHQTAPLNSGEKMNIVPFKFELLTPPKSRLIKIKSDTAQETKVRGFLFDFEVSGASELLRIGYESGFGEKNAMGFGCVR